MTRQPVTVLVSGNFNILHPGHLRLLRFARELGDRLLVAVNSDRQGGSSVHIPEQLRLEGVRSNNWVDEAFLMDEAIEVAIARLRPDIVVKGKEFESALNPEQHAVEAYGGRLVFSSGEVAFSSLDLIRKHLDRPDGGLHSIPSEFSRRHGFVYPDLVEVVRRFTGLRVCVIGDLIVDEYITCDPLGMSQEDPTIVVTPIDTQQFVGGAGIVAAHAAGMGADVSLITVAGNDPARAFATSALEGFGVHARMLRDDSRPTTLKQRFRAHSKTLLRVSHLHQGSIDKELQRHLFTHAREILSSCDLLVFSDFNYGVLPQPLVDEIVAFASTRGLVMAADSQCSSQVGDISRFRGMHLLTPTEREVRVSLKNQEDGLVVVAERLRHRANARNIILKLGSEGVLLHVADAEGVPRTDRLPALNPAPIDVAGAGDSMLITAGMALASGSDAWQAAALGSIAAGIQVGRLGNLPLNRDEVLRALRPEAHRA